MKEKPAGSLVPPWGWAVAAFALVFGLANLQFGRGFEGVAVPAADPLSDLQALAMCQNAIVGAAKDPENADVPYVSPSVRGDEFLFSWGASTKMAKLRNGLGIDAATSASCIVNTKTRRITGLTINGQTIL